MSWLVDLKSDQWKKELVGGKGYHLAEMTRWGLQVPTFGVLTTETYKAWSPKKVFPRETVQELKASLQKWDQKYYAVRSSMSKEDGATTSFAGIFETYLFVEAQDVLEKVIQCYESVHSERAQMYLDKKGYSSSDLGVAVVVQVMVDAQASGVAFSRNPQGHSGLILIEAGLGLGEGVVSGHVTVDQIKIDRFNTIWDYQVNTKHTRSVYAPEQKKVSVLEIVDDESSRPALSSEQIKILTDGLLLCEDKMHQPADIEWATDQKGKVYFLQARPITQNFAALELHADTNLAESYPNRASRLTADVVPRAYEKVIGETITLLGISWQKNPVVQKSLKELITCIGGHLYYHLKNYYTVLYLFPGGEKNIQAWHDMIGGSRLHVEFPRLNLTPRLKKLIPLFNLFYYWVRHDAVFHRFIEFRFAELQNKKKEIAATQTSQDSALLPLKFFNDVNDWGLTALNDLLIIIGLKILNQIIKKNALPAHIITQWLKTNEGVDSIEALESLKQLHDEISDASFWNLFDTNLEQTQDSWAFIYSVLEKNHQAKKVKALQKFLEKFGERCFEELKLESMPFSESPAELFKVLKNTNLVNLDQLNKKSPEKIDLSKVSFVHRILLKIFIPLTQKAVQARESTRLMRGRFYGLIRLAVLRTADLFLVLHGKQFPNLKRLDFFNLTMDELHQFGAGQLTTDQLHEIIQRHHVNAEQKNIDYPEFYAASESDPTPYFIQQSQKPISSTAGRILGQGVSSGTATGKALVLHDPREAFAIEDLESRILVTRSTDPAWIFIMSKCKGLISEKGSLLSHTAIVGRELGIPTVVSVKNATQIIRTDDVIKINGESGEIQKVF